MRERISANGIIEKSGDIAIERIHASGGVVAAAGIAKQGPNTRCRILVAGGVVIERFKAKGAVPDAAGQIDQRPAAIGCIGLRLRLSWKRRTDQRHGQDNERCEAFGLN